MFGVHRLVDGQHRCERDAPRLRFVGQLHLGLVREQLPVQRCEYILDHQAADHPVQCRVLEPVGISKPVAHCYPRRRAQDDEANVPVFARENGIDRS